MPLAVTSLVVTLFLLHSYTKVKSGSTLLAIQAKKMIPKNGYQFYAAIPQVLGIFTTAVAKEDARPEILKSFLHKYDSPLASYADAIVTAADAKSIDYRLIPAIAMCESTLGRNMPHGSYNAWGYAIYTGQDSGATFGSWTQGITVMADYLASQYYIKGLTTPEDIGPIYAPPSVNTGNSWSKCVRRFMDELT